MNPDLRCLQPYPFEKLATLKSAVTPPENKSPIALSIGEPRHQAPQFVLDALKNNLDRLSVYPKTKGLPQLREAISLWASQRFHLPTNALHAEQNILPVNGTREALFAFVQTIVDRHDKALVLCPNPFYQIYEGAALLAGAEPYFLPCNRENNYLPDYDRVTDDVWQRCQVLFICTPGNPTGAVMSLELLKKLISLADKHDFVIASDECYSELYFDESRPPPGLLQACAELDRKDFHRCVVFHSLSKRSNVPGLRSGFVAGDAELIDKFLLYRTYHGCAMPEHVQLASAAAWQDETHVRSNRALYQQKFTAVLACLDGCLDVTMPDAGFYLWPDLGENDTRFAQQLYARENITVLPGQYLSRPAQGVNPGENHIRIALVATLDECLDAAKRIKHFVENR
jgi:N-succinyldiaminopimelate aminotransferase